MTVMRTLWTIFVLALIAGVYFVPAPHPNETSLHYILAGETTFGEVAASVVASICAVGLLFSYVVERAGCPHCGRQGARCQSFLDCMEEFRAARSEKP